MTKRTGAHPHSVVRGVGVLQLVEFGVDRPEAVAEPEAADAAGEQQAIVLRLQTRIGGPHRVSSANQHPISSGTTQDMYACTGGRGGRRV